MDRKRALKAAGFVMAVLAVMFFAASAADAQTSACVYLKPGAGYMAEMRIVSGSWKTDWSGSFAIGSTKCQPLSNLKAGASYTVEVKAVLGETKSCTPQVPYDPNYSGSITYMASGQTWSVSCTLASGQEKK